MGQKNMFMQKYWNKFISIKKISLGKLKVKFEIDWVLMIFCFIGLYENYNEIKFNIKYFCFGQYISKGHIKNFWNLFGNSNPNRKYWPLLQVNKFCMQHFTTAPFFKHIPKNI